MNTDAASRTLQTGMICALVGSVMIAMGIYVRRSKNPGILPGYKRKHGENTEAFCTMSGRGLILCGTGMLTLAVPLSVDSPNPLFASACMILCLVFLFMGVMQYYQAEKRYHVEGLVSEASYRKPTPPRSPQKNKKKNRKKKRR